MRTTFTSSAFAPIPAITVMLAEAMGPHDRDPQVWERDGMTTVMCRDGHCEAAIGLRVAMIADGRALLSLRGDQVSNEDVGIAADMDELREMIAAEVATWGLRDIDADDCLPDYY